MREDPPARELQDLHPAAPDGGVPERWARSVNHACTIWLLQRGLLESISKPRTLISEAGDAEDNDATDSQEEAP